MHNSLSQNKLLALLGFSFLALNFVSFSSQVSIIIGTDGIIPLIISSAVMYLFAVLITYVMEKGGKKSFYDILTINLGRFSGKALYFIYVLSVIYLYSYAVRIICSQVNMYMLKDMNLIFIEGIFICVTLYAAKKGSGVLANFSKVLLYPVTFMLILLFVLCMNNMDILNMLPLFTSHPKQYLTASMHLISYNFSGVFCIPFVINDVYDLDRKVFLKKLFYIFLAVTSIFAAYYILCIGVLGVDTCRSIVFPAINIMHNRSSSGILLNRYEIIMVFVVVILYFLYCALMLSSAFTASVHAGRKNLLKILALTASVIFLFFLNDRTAGEYMAKVLHMQGYLAYVPTGFMIIFSYILLRRREI